jgi:hypothetical protein
VQATPHRCWNTSALPYEYLEGFAGGTLWLYIYSQDMVWERYLTYGYSITCMIHCGYIMCSTWWSTCWNTVLLVSNPRVITLNFNSETGFDGDRTQNQGHVKPVLIQLAHIPFPWNVLSVTPTPHARVRIAFQTCQTISVGRGFAFPNCDDRNPSAGGPSRLEMMYP